MEVIKIYLFFLILLVITGLVSVIDIFMGLKDLNAGIKLFVNLSNILFFASLIFFVIKSGKTYKQK
ncbi:hypothetical protein AS888_08030 [Peribacillus simplex]|uniref:Group-specific protein n=1 Tax=Peribacillus simplex TaxID=1478 RepID=A0A109MUI0_9BACI|nr:hypothetical protein [Peribacillus simplex]KWW15472.1 hypothetical protein AS888_08030 [Peribacillus simplex]